MKTSPFSKAFLGLAFVGLITSSAHAALIGSDNANDSAYNSGWFTGSDGGTPATFGPWALTNSGGNAGHFIGSSTSLGAPGANIDVSGESFGMFGHSGQFSEAVRGFNGSLSLGQTFSLDLAVNFRNGSKGIDLRDSSNAVLFNFNVGNLGSGDDYTVQFASSGNGSIGNTYSANTQFNLAFTQTSLTGGSWTITRSGGVTDSDMGTYSGLASNFKLYNSNTANGAAENNLFANNLSVVPEPASMLVGLMTAGCLVLRRRRR